MNSIIIAIDGYSSCGKSTLAKELAQKLEYVYVDSGAMYRAITLYFMQHNIDWNNLEEVENGLKKIILDFEYNPQKQKADILLNGINVDDRIRQLDVAANVSPVATIKSVRQFAVAQQQKMGQSKGIVMDGRDIGTVVFPQAELKLFMTAQPEIRIQRRLAELQEKGDNPSYDDVKKNIEERDYIDTHRVESPLRQPSDAIVIDNSNLTKENQLKLAIELAHKKINI